MNSVARTAILGTIGWLGTASFVLGQSFSAAAISIVIGNGPDGDNTVLSAYQRPSAAAPPQIVTQNTDQSAIVTPVGMPDPSIIVGRIEPGEEDRFGLTILLPQTVAQYAFPYDNLEQRVAMRENDPELFSKLINGGHLDPPANLLNAALQTELKRMNCYRSGIDGAWGPGSRRSIGEYFDRRSGETWPTQQPSMELFRTIILNEDVACPTPVAAPVAQRPAATTTKRTTTTKRASAPKPKPKRAAPKPKPAEKPKITVGGGIGVFR
ncbi:hypothetical protein [Nereida sp. MMG025]|uniref:hypothetical protein n=1 Tax=Nereida sp. MMG025 TaxID=2909981 RepID=UPI001F38AC48|nr:hypothetical protein [Nereida sp. MMG025]MCF6445761.1 hypothetical protein [Nereida sp. MMG025]